MNQNPAPIIQQSAHFAPPYEPLPFPNDGLAEPESSEAEAADLSACRREIDLPTVLRLAGANNLQIAFALERVTEAHARFVGAQAAWLPTLNAGIGYNRHTGRIQDTRGGVIEVRRSSLFSGGGAGLGSSALAGGSGGPARLGVDLSLTDALFDPLAARQVVRASAAGSDSVFNNVLLQTAVAYQELVRAQRQRTIAKQIVQSAQELSKLTEDRADRFIQPADVARVQAEFALRKRAVFAAEERVGVAAAELARLLRLEPGVFLYTNEGQPAQLDMVRLAPLRELIAQAHGSRPEIAQAMAFVNESYARLKQEQWRPWLPNLTVGVSGGSFGGGPNSFVGNFSDRTDFDALAVWQLQNLGLGNLSLQSQAASRHRQAHLIEARVRDQITAEVTMAFHQVQSRERQLVPAAERETAANRALTADLAASKRKLTTVEAVQAIAAAAAARSENANAIVEYNQAQFRLLRALGQPPESSIVDPDETTAPQPPQ